ncbi:hypothetical protein ACLOJK_020115 [Asimina triloba]
MGKILIFGRLKIAISVDESRPDVMPRFPGQTDNFDHVGANQLIKLTHLVGRPYVGVTLKARCMRAMELVPRESGQHAIMLHWVRRYVYHDVVRLDDLEKLIDCSFVQPYTINSAKVVFLNQRPQSRPFKGSANNCLTCDRILQEPFQFCSLSCKVDHVVQQGDDLSSILYRFDESDFAFSQFEGLRMDGSDIADDEDQITSSSTLEDPLQFRASSCSSHSSGGGALRTAADDSEVVKRKKGSGFLPNIVLSLSRRKGAPHRSPLS